MLLGLILLPLSGIAQGSFGLGHKRYAPLSWECFWGLYCAFCCLLTALVTFLFVPDFGGVLSSVDFKDALLPVLCGVGWGVSTIAFSKAVLSLGISLCFGINMGVSAVVGTLIPFLTDGNYSPSSLYALICGVVVTLTGIVVITKAGLINGGDSDKKKNIGKGVILAIVSGLCSGFQNVGFSTGTALSSSVSGDIPQSLVQWFFVLVPGMLAATLICLVIAIKNKSLSTFKNHGTPRRAFVIFGASVLWLAAAQLYGISAKLLGDNGASIAWLVFNAIALIVSNFWGVKTGEWNSSKKARFMLYLGDAVLVAAWIFIMFV